MGPGESTDGGAHMAMIHDACGNETTQGQVCSSCGQVLVAPEMTWVKPWKNVSDTLVPAVVLDAPRAADSFAAAGIE